MRCPRVLISVDSFFRHRIGPRGATCEYFILCATGGACSWIEFGDYREFYLSEQGFKPNFPLS